MNAPPAFLFYADDFLGGTLNFTDAEVGLYVRLLCTEWTTGSLPDDDTELAAYGKGGSTTVPPRVRAKFDKGPDGRLRNDRMERERIKQALWRTKCAEGGRRGGGNPAFKKGQPNPYLNKGKGKGEDIGKGKGDINIPPSSFHSPLSKEETPLPPNGGMVTSPQSDPLEIPENLKTAAFTAEWARWMTFRRGMKKPGNWVTMFQAQLKQLSEYGPEGATECLGQSIRNGWQGLFPPKANGHQVIRGNSFMPDQVQTIPSHKGHNL